VDNKEKLIGTGAFKWVDRKPGISIQFEKNANWWQSGKPYLNAIEVGLVADAQAMVSQLEGGTFDLIDKPTIPDVTRLKKDPKYSLLLNEFSGGDFGLGFNTKTSPTSSHKLRQAISFATDRKRFADTVMQGLAEPLTLPWPKHSSAYDAAKNQANLFDLDKARKALDESGLRGAEVDVIISTASQAAANTQLAEIMQADLAKIGLKLNIKLLEVAAHNQISKDLVQPFINPSINSFSNLEPSTMFTFSANWTPQSNNSGYSNASYTELVNKMGAEPDAAKRKALYNEVNDFILDQSFRVAVASVPNFSAMKADVKGTYYSQAPQMRNFETVWLDR
jgi:peptide/nickel transport system substrate-binding protein